MNSTGEVIAGLVGITILLLFAVAVVTFPLAAIGWAIYTISNIFGAEIDYTYWSCVVGGTAAFVVVALVRLLR